ncbi:uncharacterized protein LOC126354091 [Schistocerca gregaria]|uniref:uncharacterized protein LOC126354091 n=1 Tax=Schistocerca gregaria TaxID=7010 RepID=UPI00211F0E8E|nr:uncharacterized protein LOC126354091 [Schistocerca gregaria]
MHEQSAKKWKSLRQQFKERLNSLPRQASGGAAHTAPVQWPYFEAIMFLRDNFEPRATSGNLDPVDTSDTTEHNSEYSSHFDEAQSQPTTSLSSPLSPVSSNRTETPPNSTPAERRAYRKRPRPVDPIAIQLIETEKENLHMHKEKEFLLSEKNDEGVVFFMSLIPHVRGMTPLDKMSLRIDVQKLVMERQIFGSKLQRIQ